MEKIGIAHVLNKIKNAGDFSIVFVRSTKDKGSLKVVNSAVHGYNYSQFKPRQKKEYMIKQQRSKHQLNGTIPIIDLEAGEQLTPLISHMIFFNGKKIIH